VVRYFQVSAPLEISSGAETWKYLTTDHLGTPILSTDSLGNLLWQGGFEPFGADYSGAQAAGVFLRFPGQWDDPIWQDASLGAGVYYNVFRWYEKIPARYTRADPLKLLSPADSGIIQINNLYTYAASKPSSLIDPLGLRVVLQDDDLEQAYQELKECFLLFRILADYFESDTNFFGLDRTWTIRRTDERNFPCQQGSNRASESRTIFVPADLGCMSTKQCIFHELFERWAIDAGGFPPSQMGAGPADDRARHFEKLIPLECCPCRSTP